MINRQSFVTALFGTAVLLVTNAGFAAETPDFIFNVPVNLKAIHPDVNQNPVFIKCRVFKRRGGYAQENVVAVSHGLGRDPALVSLDAGGNFTGTIRVNAYRERGMNPADGRYYECDLILDHGPLVMTTSRPPGTEARYASRPGTPRAVRVSGPIPGGVVITAPVR